MSDQQKPDPKQETDTSYTQPTSVILDQYHHDQPERHLFGLAFHAPVDPQPIQNAVAGAFPGSSDTPAREDHVHGGMGFIIKNGVSSLVTDAASSVTFTYPTAFPTSCDTIVPGCGINGAITNVYMMLLILRSASQFGFQVRTLAGALVGAGFTVAFDWIAIGH